MKSLYTCLFLFLAFLAQAQTLEVSCEGVSDADATANLLPDGSTHADHPYTTWSGAVTQAAANNTKGQTISFVRGAYSIGANVVLPGDDGDCSTCTGPPNYTGVDLTGLTVEGNGSVIRNPLPQSQVRFAQIDADSVTIRGFTFYDFNSTGGSAMQIYDVQGIVIEDCTFDNCDLAGSGIEIGVNRNPSAYTYSEDHTDVSFRNCTFSNNVTASSHAMLISHNGCNPATELKVNLEDCDWACNFSQHFGGALAISHRLGGCRGGSDPGPIVTISKGSFYGNVASTNGGNGGAIAIQDNSSLNIDSVTFTGNAVQNHTTGSDGGGAIYMISGSSASITNSDFHRNSASRGTSPGVYGGAINNDSDGLLEITNCSFIADTAARGGALYLAAQTRTIITNCNITDNHAISSVGQSGGGGIYVNAGGGIRNKTYLEISGTSITNNVTAETGSPYGGLHIESAETSTATTAETRDSILLDEVVICGNLDGNGADADYSIREDLLNIFDTAFESTIFSGTNTIGEGYAYDDFSASYNMGSCPSITSPSPNTTPSCPTRPADPICNTLPIELIEFTAELESQNSVLLNWLTATESNTDYFGLERSTDGFVFETIGQVQAVGSSTDYQYYNFTDAFAPQGDCYYRLRSVDFDGKITYSDLAVVTVNPVISGFEVYPNPATGYVLISTGWENALVDCFDAQGKLIRRLQSGAAPLKVNISDWPRGLYSLRMSIAGRTVVQKLIVR